MGIGHRVDIVIWVFNGPISPFVDGKQFILRRSCVGCISVFVEVFGS